MVFLIFQVCDVETSAYLQRYSKVLRKYNLGVTDRSALTNLPPDNYVGSFKHDDTSPDAMAAETASERVIKWKSWLVRKWAALT